MTQPVYFMIKDWLQISLQSYSTLTTDLVSDGDVSTDGRRQRRHFVRVAN